jgi:hypothetical protein
MGHIDAGHAAAGRHDAPEDVAEAVVFVVTRPRTHLLEVAFRP